ncbi:lipopolysaccharide-binding protein-like isoform X2 [Notamacropus eugenii]|uniref:lipopolysaccharide-binding protein-like isoform X2 n=1 Tax=Notamacropus eugenii TaxID=9315 RepID=UPI003B6802C6
MWVSIFLETLVTIKVDEISSLDYSLLGPPQITWQNLDVMFKGEFFSNIHHSPVPFDAPALSLPQENNHMVYFGISDYLFNTGSMVYQEAGVMNFSITDDMIFKDFGIHLSTNLFKNLIPKLTTAYPNMQMEFQVYPATFPILTFSPGNVTITPNLHVEAFTILPSALPKSVFCLSVTTNVSATVMLNSSRITGSIHSRSRLAVELKHSEIGLFDVVRIEKILNFLTATLLIPTVNEKFKKGFALPLPRDIYFYDLVLQPYKNFLLLGANIQ